MAEKREMKVKITDDVLKAAYANFMRVAHTREEFLLDFVNLFPPEGMVTARVVTSPGHLKRIIKALRVNLNSYEKKFGIVQEAPEPSGGEGIGFRTK